MPNAVLRRFPSLLCAFVIAGLPAGRALADLVWTPQNGWQIEGGVLSGLVGEEGRNAIDLMNKARAAEEKGNDGTAARDYEKVAQKYPNSIWAPEAYYRAGHVRLVRKQYDKAFVDYQHIISTYPSTRRFNEVIGLQYRIAAELLNGARGRIFWSLLPGLFTARDRGIEFCEQLLLNAPYSDYAPLTLMEVATGQQWLGHTEESIDALDRFINNYPQSILAPDAYLKLAQANATLVAGPYYDQTSTNEAITYFQDFMILFPGDHNVAAAEKGLNDMKTVLAQSKIKMADFYFYRRSNFVAARVFYNEAITAYPDSEVANLAKKRLAAVDAAAAKAKNSPQRKKFLGIF